MLLGSQVAQPRSTALPAASAVVMPLGPATIISCTAQRGWAWAWAAGPGRQERVHQEQACPGCAPGPPQAPALPMLPMVCEAAAVATGCATNVAGAQWHAVPLHWG